MHKNIIDAIIFILKHKSPISMNLHTCSHFFGPLHTDDLVENCHVLLTQNNYVNIALLYQAGNTKMCLMWFCVDLFIQKADAVYQRLHEMNPMVDLVADKDDISDKPESFLERFDVVCLLGQPMGVQVSFIAWISSIFTKRITQYGIWYWKTRLSKSALLVYSVGL